MGSVDRVLRPRFKAKQVVVKVGKLKIGGLPGSNPTLLIGSIFYHNNKLLLDESSGRIDKDASKKVIEDAMTLAEEYGLSFALDVVFPSIESIETILPFVAEFDELVLFLDSPDPM